MNIDEFRLYKKCVDQWGTTSQILMVIEELNELAIELCHSLRVNKPFNIEHITEEIVDVKLMLDQLQYILKISDGKLKNVRYKKIERLKELLGIEQK